MRRKCACGAVIPPQIGPGRPRVKCETCKPSVRRERPAKTPAATVSALVKPESVGTLEAAIRAELDRYGRADSPDGAAALYAARLLDVGGHTGSSAASLLRECRSATEAAIKGATGAGDVVDELRA